VIVTAVVFRNETFVRELKQLYFEMLKPHSANARLDTFIRALNAQIAGAVRILRGFHVRIVPMTLHKGIISPAVGY
jgi:hypothetical protein